MMSQRLRMGCALGVALFCILMANPALAHTGSLWGIDLTSVITLRDQVRVMAHHHDGEKDDEKEGQEEEGSDSSTAENNALDQVRTVVIDPGHGGDNSGATGLAGVPEKELTLELAYQLREELQEKYPELRVILTRYWDTTVELTDRVHMANLANADLFISLHYNAAPHDRAIGFETYFLQPEQVTPGSEESQGLPLATTDTQITGIEPPQKKPATWVGQRGATLELIRQDLLRAHQHDLSGTFAETIQNHFVKRLDSVDRGVKQANFAVLQGAHMPSVVVEAGFLTHPEEGFEVLTSEHQSLVTSSLIAAVEDFDTELAVYLSGESPSEGLEDESESEDEADDPDHGSEEPIAACCGSY